ncbi:uncharacterized protein LOC116090906 [Mastomys coucha]|uniref:uncharacterized protein LOC116090906 n=1 Tax=Mastomys coucha TaxID=35658 RepID=UPI0012624B26|nr:uncharacterized protein LOC116090906 [Mastomys coucha]
MAAPETGGTENGAGRNTSTGTKGQVRFLREPRPSPGLPGLSALAIGGNCPSITSMGGLLRRSLPQRRQPSDGLEAGGAGRWRLELSRAGQVTPPGLLCRLGPLCPFLHVPARLIV